MKRLLHSLIVACLFESTGGAGLRKSNGSIKDERQLQDLELDYESLSLNDEFAPSFSPTLSPSESPSGSPSVSPSLAPTLSPTVSTAPSSAPSGLLITTATYSGNDPSGKSFRVEVKLDDNFQQNAWHVFQGTGSLKDDIYSQDFGGIHVGGLHKTLFMDMPVGAYTFAIVDIGNDGVSGGKVAIYQIEEGRDDTLLWEMGGNFGFLVEKPFLIQ